MSPISSTLANASAYGYRTLAAAGGTAYESIASVNGTGSSNVITFSSIPSTYQFLQLRVNAQGNGGSGGSCYIRFNGVSSNSYSYHYLRGVSGSVSASGYAPDSLIDEAFRIIGSPGNSTTAAIIDIHDYASTTRNKTVRSFWGLDTNAVGFVELSSGLFNSTAAVTSLTITNSISDFTTASTFSLYGIKGA